MSSDFQPLHAAHLAYDAAGRPYSTQYGDRYQPAQADMLAQARTVFLTGCGLPQRWQASVQRSRFTVLETGFGLGVNFLALWHAWASDPQRPARLHVVSLEAHPLSRDALACAHANLPPEVQALAAQLRAQWPPALPGLHRLDFAGGALTLTLGFGLAQHLAPLLDARADAFFLDGFAPARNPEMWSPALFAALAQLAAPGATLTTWCSAGAVRRGLQDAGFAVTRVAGGRVGAPHKRHLTHAVFQGPGRAALPDPNRSALVVGAGLAGAGVAHALASRGWQVAVCDPALEPTLANGPAGVHRGHLAAALTPLIDRDDSPRARLSRAGHARALARWSAWPNVMQRCGTVQPARDAAHATRLQATLAALAFPQDWLRWVEGEELARLAGLALTGSPADAGSCPVRGLCCGLRGGLYFRDGLLVRPPLLLAALLGHANIQTHTRRVARLHQTANGWQARAASGTVLAEAATVVLANAAAAPALLPAECLEAFPKLRAMQALAGEISLLPADTLAGGPRCIVGGAGYVLPAVDGWCVAGSTYVHGAQAARLSTEGRRVNLHKAARLLGREIMDEAGKTNQVRHQTAPGWAGWRAVLPGRLPVIGPVPEAPGLWLATGYASRGLSWSALAGEIIAASLEGEPMPIERDLLAAIAPR